jgi:NADPH-ferrihemoprotein reductase
MQSSSSRIQPEGTLTASVLDKMPLASTSDVAIITVGLILAALYLFRDSIFSAGSSKSVSVPNNTKLSENGGGNPRDFIAKMKAGVRGIFTGSPPLY